MLEKITSSAEKLATSVSESRRGFLGRLGKLALGAAAGVSGFLVSANGTKAATRNGYCALRRVRGSPYWYYWGWCVSPTTCQYWRGGPSGPVGTFWQSVCGGSWTISRTPCN